MSYQLENDRATPLDVITENDRATPLDVITDSSHLRVAGFGFVGALSLAPSRSRNRNLTIDGRSTGAEAGTGL